MIVGVMMGTFKLVHRLYTQSCQYIHKTQTEDGSTGVAYDLTNVRIQQLDDTIVTATVDNPAGGFALYYLIDSANASQGLPADVQFQLDSIIVYQNTKYVVKSVKETTLRNLAQYKVVFK